MSPDPFVAGVGMTPFGVFPEATVRSLSEAAVAEALSDAGVQPDDVDLVVFGNAAGGLMSGQEMIRGQSALRHTGLLGQPIINVENACASSSTAFSVGCTAIRAGEAGIVVVVGAEKLTDPRKQKSLDAIASAVDLEELDALDGALAGAGVQSQIAGGPSSRFMAIYARMARRYLDRTGATVDDFAAVAAKNSRHGALNPRAHYRQEISAQGVLASRPVIDPLTIRMCCPVSDGAAAVVLCSEAAATQLGARVRVAATTIRSGTDGEGPSCVTSAARAAYQRADVDPGDIDVIEVHDAASSGELIVYEELGLCPEGGAADLLRSGATELGGDTVVNPSGGLVNRGHPIGATGCAQLVELTEQLLGRSGPRQVEGAKIALAENGGGYLLDDVAAASIVILMRD
jgi:acetyl-CoA acetyltransferase